MYRVALLFTCVVASRSHALPIIVTSVVHNHAPLLATYPLHGYGHAFAGFGYGLLGHGLVGKPLAHHILKRFPHLVAAFEHTAHVAPIAHAALAVSHQSRVDVHTSPVLPDVKPVVAPLLHAAPLLHKSFVAAPLHIAAGLYNHHAVYPHLGHY